MLTDQQLNHVKRRLIPIQFVAFAMFAGAVAFTYLVTAIADWSTASEPNKMLTLMGAGTALLMYGISFGATIMFPRLPDKVPKPVDGNSNPAEEKKAINGILALLTTETVVRYALFQGGIFLNVMVFMLEPRWTNVVVALIGMALMVFCFPLRFWMLPNLVKRFGEWKTP